MRDETGAARRVRPPEGRWRGRRSLLLPSGRREFGGDAEAEDGEMGPRRRRRLQLRRRRRSKQQLRGRRWWRWQQLRRRRRRVWTGRARESNVKISTNEQPKLFLFDFATLSWRLSLSHRHPPSSRLPHTDERACRHRTSATKYPGPEREPRERGCVGSSAARASRGELFPPPSRPSVS